MPNPIVTDPRQNHHGWWGTVVFVEDPKSPSRSANGDSGVQHVFLKTNRESHYVSQGTAVELKELGDSADAALQQLRMSGVSETVLSLIQEDLANLKASKVKFHQITAIDDAETTALARMHNLVTEVCFNNDHWLDSAGDVGAKAIREGRKLPSLKQGVPEPTR